MNNFLNFKTYIGLVLLSIITNSTLSVYNYESLSEELKDPTFLNINYSVANFGFAPFGKTMMAKLVESPGLDTECFTNDTEDYQQIQDSFLLIPRGECTFVTKALHAQELGAQMAIIMDNQTHERKIIMKDDGYGYKVKIPAIFINYREGEKLVNLLASTEKKIILKIQFPSEKTQVVDVVFYLQAFNRRSYQLVESFKTYYDKISKHITFTTVHSVFKCGADKCKDEDCYVDGEYCAVHYPHGKSARGKDVLDQQIREDLIQQNFPKQWWAYMKCIDRECSQVSQVQQCSNKCARKNSINETLINQKQKESFDYGGKGNNILQQHSYMIKNSGVDMYPGVTLNSKKIKGSLNGEFIFDDICNTLVKPPGECNKYTKVRRTFETLEYSDWMVITLSIILGGGLFVLLFCLYRRYMKNKMTNEMQGRVDDMVSKYIQFYSERNSRK